MGCFENLSVWLSFQSLEARINVNPITFKSIYFITFVVVVIIGLKPCDPKWDSRARSVFSWE